MEWGKSRSYWKGVIGTITEGGEHATPAGYELAGPQGLTEPFQRRGKARLKDGLTEQGQKKKRKKRRGERSGTLRKHAEDSLYQIP